MNSIESINFTSALISTAAKLHDLEDARELIQGTLGFKAGALSASFFGAGRCQEWGKVNEVGRLRMLVDYVSSEQMAAQSSFR